MEQGVVIAKPIPSIIHSYGNTVLLDATVEYRILRIFDSTVNSTKIPQNAIIGTVINAIRIGKYS